MWLDDWPKIVVTFLGSSGIWAVFHRVRMRRLKKKILRDLLTDERWTWRTLERLQIATASDAETTKELLLEIGATAGRDKEGNEIWTLKK